LATPKSAAKLPICEMTINPDVDISDIIRNISQKIGCFSIAPVASPDWLVSGVAARVGAGRRPCAASTPTTPKIIPYSSRVV
jgi:hypothetical protein